MAGLDYSKLSIILHNIMIVLIISGSPGRIRNRRENAENSSDF